MTDLVLKDGFVVTDAWVEKVKAAYDDNKADREWEERRRQPNFYRDLEVWCQEQGRRRKVSPNKVDPA